MLNIKKMLTLIKPKGKPKPNWTVCIILFQVAVGKRSLLWVMETFKMHKNQEQARKATVRPNV